MPPRGRLAGIDWGMRRVGIAVTDIERKFAFARNIISAENGNTLSAADITGIFDENDDMKEIAGVIVGLPLYFDGTESETTKKVRMFAEGLAKEKPSMPVAFMDETLSSAEACERGHANDAEAAEVILEDAIAAMQRIKG